MHCYRYPASYPAYQKQQAVETGGAPEMEQFVHQYIRHMQLPGSSIKQPILFILIDTYTGHSNAIPASIRSLPWQLQTAA